MLGVQSNIGNVSNLNLNEIKDNCYGRGAWDGTGAKGEPAVGSLYGIFSCKRDYSYCIQTITNEHIYERICTNANDPTPTWTSWYKNTGTQV